MNVIHAKFVLWNVKSNTIRTYQTGPSIYPLYDHKLEDVTIILNQNGSVTMEGDEILYGISFHDESPEHFDYKIHPSWIEKTRFRKKDVVRAGWHRKLDKEHKKITLSKYTIIQS